MPERRDFLIGIALPAPAWPPGFLREHHCKKNTFAELGEERLFYKRRDFLKDGSDSFLPEREFWNFPKKIFSGHLNGGNIWYPLFELWDSP